MLTVVGISSDEVSLLDEIVREEREANAGRCAGERSRLQDLRVDAGQVVRRHGRCWGRLFQRWVVQARRIMLRTVMIVSARSKKASMTVLRRS